MKYPSIIVKVPGDMNSELWLSLTEAKKLRDKLDKKIAERQAKLPKKCVHCKKKLPPGDFTCCTSCADANGP